MNLNIHMSVTLIEYVCIGRNTIPLAGTTKPGSFQVRGQSKSSIAISHWQEMNMNAYEEYKTIIMAKFNTATAVRARQEAGVLGCLLGGVCGLVGGRWG